MTEDEIFIANNPDISELLTRKFGAKIYQKTFKDLPAAVLLNSIFVARRLEDD